jgi:hypothetical protein
MDEVQKMLGEIEDRVRMVREALRDEHEGNVKHHTGQIILIAMTLDARVRSW